MNPRLIWFSCCLILISVSLSHAQQPVYQWAKALGGIKSDSSNDIKADSSGYVYLTGTIRENVDLDPGAGTYMVNADTSRGKLFLAKYDPLGNLLWAALWNKGVYDTPYTLDFFPNGDIMLTGYYDGMTDMDPGPGTFMLNSSGSLVYFVLRLTSAGNFVWAKDFGGVYNTPKVYSEIDSNGNIYIAGFFSNTRDFNPGTGNFMMTASSRDIFIMKLNNAGNFVWAAQTTGTINNWVYDLALSPQNELIITGTFSGTTDFDPGPGIVSLTAGTTISSEDFFVAKYSNSGAFMWVNQFVSGSTFSRPAGIETDSDGIIYLAGLNGANTDFDPGPGTYFLNGSYRYLLKLFSDGTFYNVTGLSDRIFPKCIELDNFKNVYITGSFRDTLDADPGPGIYNLTTDSIGYGIFVFALDSSSNLLWADGTGGRTHFGIQQNDGLSVYADIFGNVYFTGKFEDPVLSFGPFMVTNSTPWTLNYIDVYFGKIASITTDIIEYKNPENTLVMYPNPADNYIMLKPGTTNPSVNNIYLYNSIGSLVVVFSADKFGSALSDWKIDITHLPTGIYFVKVDGVYGRFVKM